MEDNQNAGGSALRTLFFFLVLVAIVAAGVYYTPQMVPQPKIGIVRVNYDIFSVTAGQFLEQMEYARDNSDIAAVVLIINSSSPTFHSIIKIKTIEIRYIVVSGNQIIDLVVINCIA